MIFFSLFYIFSYASEINKKDKLIKMYYKKTGYVLDLLTYKTRKCQPDVHKSKIPKDYVSDEYENIISECRILSNMRNSNDLGFHVNVETYPDSLKDLKLRLKEMIDNAETLFKCMMDVKMFSDGETGLDYKNERLVHGILKSNSSFEKLMAEMIEKVECIENNVFFKTKALENLIKKEIDAIRAIDIAINRIFICYSDLQRQEIPILLKLNEAKPSLKVIEEVLGFVYCKIQLGEIYYGLDPFYFSLLCDYHSKISDFIKNVFPSYFSGNFVDFSEIGDISSKKALDISEVMAVYFLNNFNRNLIHMVQRSSLVANHMAGEYFQVYQNLLRILNRVNKIFDHIPGSLKSSIGDNKEIHKYKSGIENDSELLQMYYFYRLENLFHFLENFYTEEFYSKYIWAHCYDWTFLKGTFLCIKNLLLSLKRELTALSTVYSDDVFKHKTLIYRVLDMINAYSDDVVMEMTKIDLHI